MNDKGIKVDLTEDMCCYKRISVKIGDTYGIVTIAKMFRYDGKGETYCDVICKYGKEHTVKLNYIVSGNPKSCHCEKVMRTTTHNLNNKYPELVRAWRHMRNRCYDETNDSYEHYGARGIKPISWWYNAEEKPEILIPRFVYWAIANGWEKGLTLDRIDNDGPYAPWNCRWVTNLENQRNKRNNLWIEAFGERKVLSAWAEDKRCQVGKGSLSKRIKGGMCPEEAITKKGHYDNRKYEPLVLEMYKNSKSNREIATELDIEISVVRSIVNKYKDKV